MNESTNENRALNRAFFLKPSTLLFHATFIVIGLAFRCVDFKILSYCFMGSALGSSLAILTSKERIHKLKPILYGVAITMSVGCVGTLLASLTTWYINTH